MKNIFQTNCFLKNIRLISFLFLTPTSVFSQEVFTSSPGSKTVDSVKTKGMVYSITPGIDYVYYRPGAFDFLKHSMETVCVYTKNTFQKKNMGKIGAMFSATALLVALDQPILDEAQRFGRRIGLTGNNRMKRIFYIFGQFPIEVPRDIDTGLYFIGDGWTDTGITASFFGYGLFANDNRALTTASQLAEGIVTSAFITQLLKHITGRESPFRSSAPGGKWRFFPNQIEYHKKVPKYDAFPSGHLAVSYTMLTVIAENYPNNKFVRPIGYTLLTVLSFEMLNNGVHWFSDYPLALAIGHSVGKIITSRGKKVINRTSQQKSLKTSRIQFFPYAGSKGFGFALSYSI